jgi:hypothetical protein
MGGPDKPGHDEKSWTRARFQSRQNRSNKKTRASTRIIIQGRPAPASVERAMTAKPQPNLAFPDNPV